MTNEFPFLNKDALNFYDQESDYFYICDYFNESIIKNIMPTLIKKIENIKNQKNAKIKFLIDSDGGNGYYLWDLISLFEKAKKQDILVETYVYSHAYSCGSLLACAGTKGYRFVGEYAEHLCHFGSSGTGRVFTPLQAERMKERVDFHFQNIRDIYKKYATIKNLDKALKDDCYYIRGQDILDNGLADEIVV